VVPSEVAADITRELHIPTIGIGAGPACDAQVLVWQDMAGLRGGGKPAKFVKEFAQVGDVLRNAATRFGDEVRGGAYPGPEHEYH
jgi:3-methyl-2-oxobutanoate hydroxymethyltransferase